MRFVAAVLHQVVQRYKRVHPADLAWSELVSEPFSVAKQEVAQLRRLVPHLSHLAPLVFEQPVPRELPTRPVPHSPRIVQELAELAQNIRPFAAIALCVRIWEGVSDQIRFHQQVVPAVAANSVYVADTVEVWVCEKRLVIAVCLLVAHLVWQFLRCDQKLLQAIDQLISQRKHAFAQFAHQGLLNITHRRAYYLQPQHFIAIDLAYAIQNLLFQFYLLLFLFLGPSNWAFDHLWPVFAFRFILIIIRRDIIILFHLLLKIIFIIFTFFAFFTTH